MKAGALLPQSWPVRVLLACVLLAAIAGGLTGYFLRLDLPDVRTLDDYNPPVMSHVIASDGSEVATFAEQRRILIPYHEIPPMFLAALVATEDANFYRHAGLDFRGILRALWSDLRSLKMAQGASTVTQQLARNLFLHPDKTIRRKLQEAILALEIERQYTKQEILHFYCNQVYMGHGRYGLEAAAHHYYGKSAKDLTLTESATIAGLIQRPESISPLKNPERALLRRNHVLRRMVEAGVLDPETAQAASQSPLDEPAERRSSNNAPYFVEEVRRWLQENYGSSTLYKEGFEARTTLDPRLQAIANRSLDRGLRQLDRRQGWRGVQQRIPEDAVAAEWEPAGWENGIEVDDVHDGVVVAVSDTVAKVRLGELIGTLGAEEIAWTRKKRPSDFLKVGDVVRVRLLSTTEGGTAALSLEQQPLAEAALVALDPATGAIRAMVGGFEFERSEFNRAIQAKRQTGSAFKPFVYAAALSQGWTLGDVLLDEPTVFLDRRNPDPYQPENYSNKYYKTITLRRAMEKSANIATVKLLDRIGYEPVIDMARRLGITSQLHPFPSLALGVFEVSLLELTAAYGTFANQGVLVEPHLLEDVRNREGALVVAVEPEVRDAVSPQIAYLMNRVLSGVITDGTGRAAKSLNLNLAGKTGTTDNNTDAWFIGYSPRLAVGVWVGFDEPRSLGRVETGAQAALPIWRAFMEEAFEDAMTEDFAVPPGVTIVSIDRQTGLKADLRAGCAPVFSEVFVRGTEPTEYCSSHQHRKLRMPYPFQRFALNEEGALMIPEDELRRLLDAELDVFAVDGGRRLEAYTPDGAVSLPVEILPAGKPVDLPPWLRDRFDTSGWKGLDGRPATILWLH